MDGGMAATATPSHSHHLESPFVTLPPPTSHLMLIFASSPLLRQQCADANTQHPNIVIPPPTRHRPLTIPFVTHPPPTSHLMVIVASSPLLSGSAFS